MKIVVDGNDGTGKSTLAELLKRKGYEVQDRGVPTKMTDDPATMPEHDEIYLILDVSIDLCRDRLERAGRNLDEQYHTIEDLGHYRKKFLEVAELLPRCAIIDANGTPEEVLRLAIQAIDEIKKNDR